MSFDLKIQNSCDHKILLEKVGLETDQKTIKPVHYIANSTSIELFRFGFLVDRSTYVVADDEEYNSLHKKSKLTFYKKEQHQTPFYDLTYVTVSTDCPKCLGVKYLDDLSYNEKGFYKTIENENLLAQVAEKYVITELSSNKFHPWLGTSLINLVGTKILDASLIKVQIREEVSKVFGKIKDIQKQQVGSTQEVTLGERLDRLISVDTVQDQEDPSIFLVTIKYQSKSGNYLSLEQRLELTQLRQRIAL